MPLRKPIVVLDSNVVFSALFSSKGYSFELLKLLRLKGQALIIDI